MEGLAFIPIGDPSQPAEARRVAFQMADELDFTEAARGKLGIVVTEAATNLLKHAGGGQIILRCGDARGVEVLALDSGPGMRSVAECMRDGFSTAGSPGTGLGAIDRMGGGAEIYSREGMGTIVQVFCESGRNRRAASSQWDVTCLTSAVAGETVCGDTFAVRQTPSGLQLLAADGLGHGPLASEASLAARDAFEQSSGDPLGLIERIHANLRATRGAAVAVAEIDVAKERVLYCGIGNISGCVVRDQEIQHMVSLNGISGHQNVRARQFEYEWKRNSMIVMHSDGLSSRWHLSNYPELVNRRSSLVAAVLYRDWRRSSDDATVVVGKQSLREI